MDEGLHGLLDFTGVPVGQPEQVPRAGASGVGGRRHVSRALARLAWRSVLEEVEIRRKVTAAVERVALAQGARKAEFLAEQAYHLRKSAEAAYSVLLAEL